MRYRLLMIGGMLLGAGVLWLAKRLSAFIGYDWTVTIGLMFVVVVGQWLAGFLGYDQWPNPHGRYYKRWLRLPEDAGDYYDWLARQKDWRDPWAMWATREHAEDFIRERRAGVPTAG